MTSPSSHLVVPGVDPADQRTSWEVLHARREAYYRAREEAERVEVVTATWCAYCRGGVHGRCSLFRRGGAPCTCTDVKHFAALNATGGA